MRIGTLNVKVDLDDGKALASLDDMLYAEPDILGLQEWPRDRSTILRQRGTVIMFPRLRRLFRRQPTSGYVFVYPIGGQPVGYDAEKFQLVAVRSHRLARRRFNVRATRGTEVILMRRAGGTVAVLNTHLVAHHDRPLNAEAWEEGRKAVFRWSLKWIGYRRFVMGDMNKNLTRLGGSPGLVSCWAGHAAEPTFRDRVIDHIYGNRLSKAAYVVPTPSDHHGVIADYAD